MIELSASRRPTLTLVICISRGVINDMSWSFLFAPVAIGACLSAAFAFLWKNFHAVVRGPNAGGKALFAGLQRPIDAIVIGKSAQLSSEWLDQAISRTWHSNRKHTVSSRTAAGLPYTVQ